METASPDDVEGAELDKLQERFAQLVEKLAEHAAAGGIDADGWDLLVTLDIPQLPGAPQLAVEKAATVILGTARAVGLPHWRVVSVSATESELDWMRSDATSFPDVVGAQEVLEILGVSKQRLSQLRQADRFPEPMVELGATPVWLRSAIEVFIEGWDRRPGRRPSA